MTVLNKDNFNKIVEENERVLIDFYADWCGPCKMIAPIIEELDKEQNGLCVCKVNVDNDTELALAFKVQYIPTLAYIKNGALQGVISGYKTKDEIIDFISK